MTAGRYVAGIVLTAGLMAVLAFTARRLRGWLLPEWSGAPSQLAEVVLGVSLLVVTSEVLGAVGAFRIAPVACVCLGASFASSLLRPTPRSRTPATGLRPGRSLAVAPAVVVGAVLAAQWGDRTAVALSHGMANMDTLWYHMPFAARFVQTGWLTRLHVTHQEPLTSFYPANSELLHAVTILAFRRDIVSPLLNLGWLVVALLAGWCVGRARGAGALALVGVAAVASVPILASTQPGDASNDTMGLACFLAAVAICVVGDGRPAELAVAGLAAGLALGTKLSLVAPVAALTVGVWTVAGRGTRRLALATWAPAVAATGGFWYLRNLVRAGSPVPTLRLGVGTLALPRVELAVTGRINFSVAHYLTNTRVWREALLPALRISLGDAWPLLLGLAALGALASLLTGPRAIDRVLALVAIASAAAYVVTPQTAAGPPGHPGLFAFNLRFLAPALALGLVLLARARALQRPGARWGLLAALAVVLLGAEMRSRYAWPHEYRPVAAIVAVVTVAGALVVPGLRRRTPSPRLLAATAAGVALAVAGAGWPVQRHYLADRYVRSKEWVAGAYEWARAVRGSRIAIAGFVQQYPLYGPDLSNWVQYVGHPLPGGGFRSAATCQDWRDGLRRGRYRYVVLASDGAPSEARWTAADPAAVEILRAGPAVVYRLDGRRGDRCTGGP
ncbi:MAG TPA: hypothetical protein VKI64_12020 [Acidimicrobiales bacterium]|nr:hypothetical protein [Acidimicrobiales bacterium]